MTARTASLLTAALLVTSGAGVVEATATPALAAGVATATPLRYTLPTTETVTDVLAVGSDVWVAAGNTILITSPTGQVRRTVTGVLGVRGLALSPDGASVYASSSTAAKIVQLSTAGAIVSSWTAQSCPGKSAVAQGALWYVHGCGSADRGIARLDLGTHTDASVAQSYSAQSLTAAGSTVVTSAAGGSGGFLTSYAIGADGSLTQTATTSAGTTYDAELSPDGTQLITTDYEHNGYGVARYDAATLTLAGTFSTGPYPDAVAWSPDGSRFAGVQHALYTDLPVQIFATGTGSAVTRSTSAGAASYTNPAHEASWSRDGKYVFSLAQEPGAKVALIVTPAAGQARSTVTVTVKNAPAYGKNLTVTVRAANRPSTVVTVAVTQNGTTTRKTVTTDNAGVATWTLAGRSTGTATASVPASLTALAAAGSARFTTPSALTVTWSGAKKDSKGVAHYSAISAVHGVFQALPKRSGSMSISLQHRSGGKWVVDQTRAWTTRYDGSFELGLIKGNRKMTYRVVAKLAADSTATASPSVTSSSFIVD